MTLAISWGSLTVATVPWGTAIRANSEGGTIELYVPAALGYGERGNQGIEPNATLIFTVDLYKVLPFVEKVAEEEKK